MKKFIGIIILVALIASISLVAAEQQKCGILDKIFARSKCAPVTNQTGNTYCTQDYKPVCCDIKGNKQKVSNDCTCVQQMKGRVVAFSECSEQPAPTPNSSCSNSEKELIFSGKTFCMPSNLTDMLLKLLEALGRKV
jgi:hypothetical protein